LIAFQWLEGKVDEILLLAWGDDRDDGLRRLTRMSMSDKLKIVVTEVRASAKLARAQSRPDWWSEFEGVVARLDEERSRRNDIVHSQYDFLGNSFGPIRSKSSLNAGQISVDHQELSKDAQAALINSIAELASDLGRIHLQLVHDYGA